MESGALITAKEAVRRVLILENPAMPGSACITPLALCRAAAHPAGRGGAGASPHAVGAALHRRGRGRLHRRRRRAHDHARRATSSSRRPGPGTTTATTRKKPMVWLDGLDIPLVAMFNAGFAENGAERRAGGRPRPRARRTPSSPAACCRSTGSPTRQTSPIFNYPYARTREALARPAPRPGRPIPATATSCATSTRRAAARRSPTMGTFMQLLPKGFETAPYRSTDGTVFSVVEGKGESVIGDEDLPLEEARPLRRAELGQGRAPAPTARRCCSPSPTVRCRRSSTCGARIAAGSRARFFRTCRLPAGLMIMSRLEAGGPEEHEVSYFQTAMSTSLPFMPLIAPTWVALPVARSTV